MLDVSLRLGVLNLLSRIQQEEHIGMLYITHDLATARHFSDEIMVMCHGDIIEHGPSDDVILNPQQDYTKVLLNAAPDPEKHFAKIRDGRSVSNAAWNTSDHHLIACNSLGLWPRVPYKGVLYANRKPRSPGIQCRSSMIRVGDTYYIANSTFEWFPGVRLHESKDMVHWNLLPSPLSRTSQLDMRGNPSSGGIWLRIFPMRTANSG